MRKLIVLIPEGLSMEYFVYSIKDDVALKVEQSRELLRSGKIRLRGPGASFAAIRKLIDGYSPDAIALRIIYGGDESGTCVRYDKSVLSKLEKLVPRSPLDIPPAIKLLRTLERLVPTPEMFLFLETSFFANLPIQERTYAISDNFLDEPASEFADVRKYGYHGIFHQAAAGKVKDRYPEARRIISVCLEPVPEVAAIYAGKPVMVSSGSTPLEGLPGNSTCGDIDPGIVLLLEKEVGPEMVNEILTRESGLTAMAGKNVTIKDIFEDEGQYSDARNLFEYRVLLSCGSAIALMGGFDAVVFSGRYVSAAEKLSARLMSRLTQPLTRRLPRILRGSGVSGSPRPTVYVRESLDRIIAEMCGNMSRAWLGSPA